MTVVVRGRLLSLLAPALAVALAAVGCARGEGAAGDTAASPSTTIQTRAPAPPPAEPPPTIAIRVRDGDTGRPVRRARVTVGEASARTSRNGVARLASARKNARVQLSARGYMPRTVRVRVGDDAVAVLALWRRSTQWTMYGATASRTQAHPAIRLRPPFRRVWTRNMHGLLEFPAVVWEGVAYINNIHGYLTALSMKNGRVLWRKRLGSLTASSPAVDPERGALVVTSMSPGDVKIVSMKTGLVRWRYSTGRAEPSPVVRGNTAYLAATNGNVYALDLERRRLSWVFHGGAKITGSPALVGSRLFVGDYAGRVFALDARNGRRIWTGSGGTHIYGTVAVAGGRVFVPSVAVGLSALSARSGRLLWRIPTGAYLYSSPAVFRGRVYFGTYAGLVYSADARSGRIFWRRSAGGRVSGAVQLVAGVVYAGSLGHRITAWNWRSGRTLWAFPHGRYVPVSGNGGRLLMHGAGRLWAVEPKRRR